MRRRYFERNEWRKRVDPTFVRYCVATRRMNDPNADERTRKAAFDEASAASRLLWKKRSQTEKSLSQRVHREITKPLDGEVWPGTGEVGKAYAVNPEASVFFRQLVFLKYGLTFRELIVQAERDRNAHKKLLRIHKDFYRFRWETKGYSNLQLKFNEAHFGLLLSLFDFGLMALNELELGACFDEICPCRQRHSGRYLTNLRRRIKRACDDLISRMENFKTTVDV